jgi:hypothetical protein
VTEPFELTGVVHLVRPVGERLGDLASLRAALNRLPERALFHHTRSRLLQTPDDSELPPDDMSAWVGGVLQDRETAERMSYVADAGGDSPESLRRGWGEVLEQVPERALTARVAPAGGELVVLASEPVPVRSEVTVTDPAELMEALAAADASVWFWHLVEEPWSVRGSGALVDWLRANGETRLAGWFMRVMHSGRPLGAMRRTLVRRWRLSRIGGRLADASRQSPGERERAGREAIAHLTRRLRGDAPE